MLKILACALIIFSSAALGYLKSKDFERRQKILTAFEANVVFMQNEMSFVKTNVIDIIKKLSNFGGVTDVFYKEILTQYVNKNESTISDLWVESAHKNFKDEPILKGDLEVICLMAEGIGKSDVEGQNKIFNAVKSALKIKIDEAILDKNKNARLYKSLGFYVGVLIVVMFL